MREFRSRLSELLDDVADRRDHILLTRNGRPAAALVPLDEYQALEETAEILSDPDAIAAIEAGLAGLNRGDTVSFEALRARRTHRAPPHPLNDGARVVLAGRARADLLQLDWPLIDAIEDALGQLERQPAASHPLRGRLRGLRALRVGSYRIVYQLLDEQQTVRVAAILHRSVTYRTHAR